jgi:hypothetical protein
VEPLPLSRRPLSASSHLIDGGIDVLVMEPIYLRARRQSAAQQPGTSTKWLMLRAELLLEFQ